MASERDRVVAYDKKNSLMKLHDPMTTLSREVTWQIKSLISPIPQSLWPPNLRGR